MSDVFENVEMNIEEPKKKKKREISEERRKQLLINLKKGRETSRINRMKKGKAKKIKKQNEQIEIDDTIKKHINKKSNKDYESELETLRNELNTYKTGKKEIKKEEPTPKKEVQVIKEEKYSFNNQDLITKPKTEEKDFSTFRSSLWD